VHLENQIPVLVLHVFEADVSKNSRIVDQDINPSKRFNGSFNDSFSVFDAVVVGNSFAASGLDLFNNGIGGLLTCQPQNNRQKKTSCIPLTSFPHP